MVTRKPSSGKRRNRHGLLSRRELGHYRLDELAAFCGVVFFVGAVMLLALGVLAGSPPFSTLAPAARALIGAAALTTVACLLYGALFEAGRLTVSRVELSSAKVKAEPLRIVHLTDLHVRRWGGLEQAVVREAARLAPDLIVLTGDYTAVPCSIADARRLIAALAGIAPVFACRGNWDFRRPHASELFAGTGARLLMGELHETVVKGTRVAIAGVDPGEEEEIRSIGGPFPSERLSICLYHYPDLIPELESVPHDLMLCGHTHGGQVRLPWLGAIVTACRAGPRYAAGLFQRGGRAAYVSRGVGTESCGMFPLRFLCPPELVLITLSRGT